MEKEIALKSFSPSCLEFKDHVEQSLFLKFMLPITAIGTALSVMVASSVIPSDFIGILLLGMSISLGMGMVSMNVMQGRSSRRKIRKFIRSQGISMSRKENISLLKSLKSERDFTFLVGDKNALISVNRINRISFVKVETEQRDPFDEAFYYALTIDNDELVTKFADMNKEVILPRDTPFQKSINERVRKLNTMVVEKTSYGQLPYGVNIKDENVDLVFRPMLNNGEKLSLHSSFKAIENECEKNLFRKLKEQPTTM